MKMLLFIVGFALVLLPVGVRAERSLIEAYQPISLLGTELEADPLGTGERIAATIVSRPTLIGGAYPEDPVHAVTLPHRIAGATEGFPQESNLIVLVGAEVRAEWGETEHRIIADFSKAKAPEPLGVTVLQVMRMTALCLQKTLGTVLEKPIRITWLAPQGVVLADAGLPLELKRTNVETKIPKP